MRTKMTHTQSYASKPFGVCRRKMENTKIKCTFNGRIGSSIFGGHKSWAPASFEYENKWFCKMEEMHLLTLLLSPSVHWMNMKLAGGRKARNEILQYFPKSNEISNYVQQHAHFSRAHKRMDSTSATIKLLLFLSECAVGVALQLTWKIKCSIERHGTVAHNPVTG